MAHRWTCLLAASFLLAAAPTPAADPEPYLVVRDVGLSADGKLVATLKAGELVAATAHEWNQGVLRLTYRRQDCLAERQAFRTQAELGEEIRRTRAAAEGQLAVLQRQSELTYAKLQELYRALLQVQHDNALVYKRRVAAVVVEGPAVAVGETGVAGEFIDILPDPRAEKLLREWRAELTQLTDKLTAGDRQRLEEVRRIFRGEQDREYYRERFAQPPTVGLQPPLSIYQVVGQRTRLYLQQNPVVTLTPGQFLYARLHPDNRTVVVTTYQGREVTGAAQELLSWRDRQRVFLDRQLELEDRVRRLENDLKLLTFRVKLYIPRCADLRYRSAQKAEFVLVPELTVPPGTGLPFNLELPADQLLAYALRVRKGQNLLDQWTKDVKQLEDELFAKTKELATARQSLADLNRDWQTALAALAEFVRQTPPPAENAP